MKIDIHTHILPRKFLDAIKKYLSEFNRYRYETVRTLWYMDKRFQIMDKYPGLAQLLCPRGPSLEMTVKPD